MRFANIRKNGGPSAIAKGRLRAAMTPLIELNSDTTAERCYRHCGVIVVGKMGHKQLLISIHLLYAVLNFFTCFLFVYCAGNGAGEGG